MIPDPNETLAEIRRLAALEEEDRDTCVDLAEGMRLFRTLDEWLTKGGRLPEAWKPIGPEKK